MMDESAVRKIVNENVRWLRWALCISDWSVNFIYGHIDHDNGPKLTVHAKISARPKYREATCYINPEDLKDEAHVLEILRHELLHVIHADFCHLQDVYQKLCQNDREIDAMDELWSLGAEKTVKRIEDLLDLGVGISVRKMIANAKRNNEAMASIAEGDRVRGTPKKITRRKKRAVKKTRKRK